MRLHASNVPHYAHLYRGTPLVYELQPFMVLGHSFLSYTNRDVERFVESAF
jgi:hypothetical protein